ncbi:GNAT family N-acetyltransferase [Paenibacillus anaericanus]|uniref:GNAT family N-acetyltransferase n=1 Tax=Paenibacillus anaericanus TaxID=170367 RepID=A0A433Y6R4_9BACL|nr:GNAT family N-acetyltransferase [Paenibacillus anaericanus]RUT44679.1 GNAT family N-acetyltransferase [Paenibacillus anaericanus]
MTTNAGEIREAISEDLEQIEQILFECKRHLEQKGIYQWNDQYPNRAYFLEKLKHGELFVIEYESEIAGSFVVDENAMPEWGQVKWQYEKGRYLLLHALFINPLIQGKGLGNRVLDFLEDMAVKGQYDGIRLDVFSKNENALKFYVKRGFKHRGDIVLPFKPVDNQVYACYEKILRTSSLHS